MLVRQWLTQQTGQGDNKQKESHMREYLDQLRKATKIWTIYDVEGVQEKDPTDKPEGENKSAEAVSFDGLVTDQLTGKPIAGASIYVREQPTGWYSLDWHPASTRNFRPNDHRREWPFCFVDVVGRVDGSPCAKTSFPWM